MMMVSCQEDACPAPEFALSLKTAQLETAYEKSLAQLDALIAYEETRISRVDYMILDADHELLQAKCERSEYDIEQLLQAETVLKQQILLAQDDLANLQSSTRSESRAMQDLKNDLVSMKRKVSDYDQIASDKLTLAKEMTHLKQEFDRLQNQNESHQKLIAEKSALERQLNSLEVQLEEERRAFERNKIAELNNQDREAQQQLRKLQEELRKEVDERRRMEQEFNERSIAWEQQKKSLEERLDKLRKQLRSTKEKLKEYQSDTLLSHMPDKIDQPRQSVASDRSASLNHSASTFVPSMTIATPGAVKVKTNFQPRPSAALGEKSSFSITPYLKRNRNAEDLSSSSDDDMRPQADMHQSKNQAKISPENKKTKRSKASHSSSHGNDGDDDDGEGQIPAKVGGGGRPLAEESILSRGMDEMPSMLGGMSNRVSSLGGKQVPKKRKVLGGQRDITLFDQEEEPLDRPKRIEKPIPSLKPSTKRPQALGIARLAFGESSSFSPLKRDKRLI